MSYDLNQDAPDSFRFTLSGHEYEMRLPTTEEVIQATEVKDKGDQAALKWFYTFVTPVSEGAPSIEEALMKASVRVMRNFNKMIESEFNPTD